MEKVVGNNINLEMGIIATALIVMGIILYIVDKKCKSETNYENINLFKEDFPLYQKFTLTQNYRSSQNILNYTNRFIL